MINDLRLYLKCASIVVTAALLPCHTASPIEVVAIITGADLSTDAGVGDNVGETGAWCAAGLRAELVVAVCRTGKS